MAPCFLRPLSPDRKRSAREGSSVLAVRSPGRYPPLRMNPPVTRGRRICATAFSSRAGTVARAHVVRLGRLVEPADTPPARVGAHAGLRPRPDPSSAGSCSSCPAIRLRDGPRPRLATSSTRASRLRAASSRSRVRGLMPRETSSLRRVVDAEQYPPALDPRSSDCCALDLDSRPSAQVLSCGGGRPPFPPPSGATRRPTPSAVRRRVPCCQWSLTCSSRVSGRQRVLLLALFNIAFRARPVLALAAHSPCHALAEPPNVVINIRRHNSPTRAIG